MRPLSALLAGAALAATLLAVPSAAHAAPAPPQPEVAFASAPEAWPRYQGQISCDPVAKPGTQALQQLVFSTYRTGSIGYIPRGCSGATSEHHEGRAWDWPLNAADPAHREVADAFLSWLTGPDAQGVSGGNARRLGVMYVIWDRRVWKAYRASDGWTGYSGASPHTDHIHVSLTWDGAMKRTSWWTGRTVTTPDNGPCRIYDGQLAPRYTGPFYASCPAVLPAPPAPACAAPRAGAGPDVPAVRRGVSWLARRTTTGGSPEGCFTFGDAGDVPLSGDWDGDGTRTAGVYRPSTSTWYLTTSPTAPQVVTSFPYGTRGDLPVVGDWNDDGRESIGVFRPSTGQWHLTNDLGGPAQGTFGFASPGDRPVVGDWNGDGTDTMGVFRPSNGTWYATDVMVPGPRSAEIEMRYGASGDLPVTGDWNGDRVDDPGMFRRETGRWYLGIRSGTTVTTRTSFSYGGPHDTPLVWR